jgi:hypothetical protein
MDKRGAVDLRNLVFSNLLRPDCESSLAVVRLIPANIFRSLDEGIGTRHVIGMGVPGFAAADAPHRPSGRTERRVRDVVGSSTIRANDMHWPIRLIDGQKLTAVC